MGLANLSLAIYRGEADYRQSLHQQGQDTFVIVGADQEDADGEPVRLGSGSVLHLPMGGAASYEGVSGEGLPEQAKCLSNDYQRAREMGSRLLEQRGSQAESGEALRVRLAASTATLRDIVTTGAAGLEHLLRVMARWMGENPDLVVVRPNLDFAEIREVPSAPKELMEGKALGAPLSLRSIHRYLQENEFTRSTYEEEIAEIKAEEPLVKPAPAETPASGAPSNEPTDESNEDAEE
jgi:hypothetical protein